METVKPGLGTLCAQMKMEELLFTGARLRAARTRRTRHERQDSEGGWCQPGGGAARRPLSVQTSYPDYGTIEFGEGEFHIAFVQLDDQIPTFN
jgi:hypothetical protein